MSYHCFKIAHVTLSMGTGGIERLIVNFARGINQNNFSMSVGCLDFGGELLDSLQEFGCSSFIVSRRPGLDWRLILELAAIFRDNKFDIIHTHNQAAHFYGGLAAKIAGIPVLVTTEHSRHNAEICYRRRLEKRILCAISDKWIAVSDEIAELAIREDKLSVSKVLTITNGIDVEKFTRPANFEPSALKTCLGLPAGSLILIMVARLNPIKNHCLLLEAVAELGETLSNLHVVLVGDGECRNQLRAKAISLGIIDRVHLLGIRQDIQELLWASDIFVLCSLSEGLPLSLLEAAAAGVPIVITKSANRAGFTHNKVNGIIAENSSVHLAKKLLEVAQGDKQQLGTMVENAKMAVVKNYSVQTMVCKYERLYHELLRQKHMID